MVERQDYDQKVLERCMRAENYLRKQQDIALSAYLKRIQRDRDEQLTHRKTDSKVLV